MFPRGNQFWQIRDTKVQRRIDKIKYECYIGILRHLLLLRKPTLWGLRYCFCIPDDLLSRKVKSTFSQRPPASPFEAFLAYFKVPFISQDYRKIQSGSYILREFFPQQAEIACCHRSFDILLSVYILIGTCSDSSTICMM